MTNTRLLAVLSAIDAINAADPVREASESGEPVARALLYGQRMTATLLSLRADASEALQIAARAQHIERWVIPRSSYPEGRIPYLEWRKALQRRHAQRAGELMAMAGYDPDEISRVGALLRKERLRLDPEVQTLEDVACLVFLKHEASEFIALHDDTKVREILGKTVRKMSAEGLLHASKLTLAPRLARLLSEAT